MMKYLNLAFLWSSLAFLVQGQRTPTISYISASMRTKQGGTIEMDCSTLYATEYPILWVKLPGDGCTDRKNFDFRSSVADTCTPVPLSSGSALIVRDNRFSMRYDTASSTYTLQIKDVQRPDEGTYQCQIIVAINNKVTKSVDLTVAQPPVITDNSTRSVVVEVGNPVELICHALGSPPPSVSWRRQNHQILPTGGVQYRGNKLKIHSVKKEDRGTYYCVADNEIGKPARRSVAVEVEFPPSITSFPTSGDVKQAYGYSAELVCQIEAYPKPTITWIHDGIQLATNHYFVVDNGYTTADDSTEARVRIKKLTYDQVGGYTCRAQNKLGSAEKKFDVQLGSQTDCNIGLCESYSSAGSSGLNTGIVFGISLIGSVILFMTVK